VADDEASVLVVSEESQDMEFFLSDFKVDQLEDLL